MKAALSILLLLLVAVSSCSTNKGTSQARINAYKNFEAKYGDSPPVFFWEGDWAEKGEAVLHAFRVNDSQSKSNAVALIGSTIVLKGDAAELRPGTWSDLITTDGIRIEIDVVPFRNVRPGGLNWRAEIKGTLMSVDFDKRPIRIVVKPEDWIADDVI